MSATPRILLDLSVAPPGGAGTYAEGFLSGLVADPGADRSDLVVLVERSWSEARQDQLASLRDLGAQVEVLALPAPGTWKARLTRGTTTRAAVRRISPDISYFPRDVAPLGVGPYAVLANNLFAWLRHPGSDAVGGALTTALLRRAARRTAEGAAAILAVSRPMAAAVEPTAPVTAIVHHGCSLPEVEDTRRPDHGRPVAMALGNLFPHKRFDLTVHGVAAARSAGADYTLSLYGGNDSSEFAKSLDQLAIDLLGEPAVRGPVHGESLAAAYRDSDVLIVTTTFESFCFPLVEAMRSGTVVVAPESDLVEEICGGHAVTYAEGDTGSLGDALVRAAADTRQRAERARIHARRFVWSSTVEQTLEILRKAARTATR